MILAIDCGSTNHKLALFDEQLRRLANVSRPVSYSVREAERVEFDPEKIWRDTVEMIREVCNIAGITPRQIKTIALTSQANTFTLLNASGETLMPFISWLDKRASQESVKLTERLSKEFHRHCSFPTPSPQLQISKLLWVARNQNLFTSTATKEFKVMSLPTFLAWRLAGLHCTDANLAAMGGMYSLAENDWWPTALAACSLTAESMGRVVSVGDSIQARQQCVELEFSPDLKIVFAGNDQTAGALANRIRNGGLVLTLGTALVAYRFAGAQPGPYPAAGCWGHFPDGGFYELMARDEGCHALDWAVEQLLPGREAEFFQLATTSPAVNAQFFPQKIFSPDAWSGSSDLAAKARAVLEGISFALRELVEGMAANRGAREVVSVIGGGSANAFWLQMVANVLNRPVQRGHDDNLLGAAMMARPGVEPPSRSESEIPYPDAKSVAEYDAAFQRWQKEGAGQCSLPYTDTKPIGAADFYFAINATFRFIEQKLGREGLQRYWTDLGAKYFSPVSATWQRKGLPAVADYWRAFFKAEPGGDVEVGATDDVVTLDVRVCPAIKHFRAHKREIVPRFCQHCYFVTEAMAAPAGFTVRIEGGDGSCRQRFFPRKAADVPQALDAIKEVA